MQNQEQHPYGDNFTLVIPSDIFTHTDTHPFYSDAMCGCHEDESLIAPVQQAYDDGLVTTHEALNIVMGKSI